MTLTFMVYVPFCLYVILSLKVYFKNGQNLKVNNEKR